MGVMERVEVHGFEMEVEQAGTGDAVVLVHGAGIADTFLPLMAEPELRESYRLIRYRRRGYGVSGSSGAPVTVGQHAADCQGLLAALDVSRVHVVGHSYGGAVALQLALDAPGLVRSLALLEPAVLRGPAADRLRENMGDIVATYAAGNHEAAADAFWTLVGGPDWRTDMARTVPNGEQQAVTGMPAMVESDVVSLRCWTFGAPEAAALRTSVLFVRGSASGPLASEASELVKSWMPQTELRVLDGANHLLHVQQPTRAAALLADFLRRTPTATPPAR